MKQKKKKPPSLAAKHTHNVSCSHMFYEDNLRVKYEIAKQRLLLLVDIRTSISQDIKLLHTQEL